MTKRSARWVRSVVGASVLALGLVAVGPTAASAGEGGTTEGGTTKTVTFPSPFTILSADCGYLPAGTTITATGFETSITTTRPGRDGVTTVKNRSHATGTAVDQNGNAYVFDYLNTFRVSNTVAVPGIYSGLMFDSFSLLPVESDESEHAGDSEHGGHGLAHLRNGFVAIFTTDLNFSPTGFFNFQRISSFGDPISFPDGAAHCDPL
jgi:hypothetical protein